MKQHRAKYSNAENKARKNRLKCSNKTTDNTRHSAYQQLAKHAVSFPHLHLWFNKTDRSVAKIKSRSLIFSENISPTTVANAGFWKGRQKLQKIWEEHKSEFEIVTLKFRPIFRPKSGDCEPKAWCPTCKGEGHASTLLTFLCNFAILATQRGGSIAPPKYAPAHNNNSTKLT